MAVTSCHDYRQTRRASRREILRLGSLGLMGVTLPDLLAGREAAAAIEVQQLARAKACIFLFMWGGPAQQDTWDMKPDAPVDFRGEFRPASTKVPGIQICEHMPQLAQRTDKLAIVRSMMHNNADHLTATHFMLTGQAPPTLSDKRAQWPNVGSVLSKLGYGKGPLPPFVSMRPKLENTVPRFVEQSQGQFAGWLGPVYDPFTIDNDPSRSDYQVGEFRLPADISVARLDDRRKLLADLDRQIRLKHSALEAADVNRRRAFELLTRSVADGNVFDLSKEPRKLRERYGMNPHGQSVLQARRLIERGVPLVTVYWPNDGIKNVSVYWDTHRRNFIDLKERLMPVTDQAFSALLDDLSDRGMLDETLIVWGGEFGRTPRVGQVNSDAGAGKDGRDHWPGCFTTVLAGGGIRGGMVYGRSDKLAAYPAEDPVTPEDLVATVYQSMGVPQSQVMHDLQNRPHLVRPGNAIRAMLG